MRDQRFSSLPFVVGEGANERLSEFTALLDAAAELRPKIVAGVLVGERRWNLKMKSGIDVKLPESDPLAAMATLRRAAAPDRAFSIATSCRSTCASTARVSRGFPRAAAARAEDATRRRRPRHELPAAPRRRACGKFRRTRAPCFRSLDVGASKIVCLIARLTPMERADSLRERTHRCKVLGIGHQRSRGVKAGAIVDLDAAENAIRLAIDAAERMAGVEVDSVVVNMSGGRLSSRLYDAKVDAARQGGRRTRHPSRARSGRGGGRRAPGARSFTPCRRGFWLDATRGVRDPKGMIGDELGAEMHVASCDAAAARNLMLAIERCHLRVGGDGRHALRGGPFDAGRRRSRTGRGAGRFRRRLDDDRACSPAAGSFTSTPSPSAAITSPMDVARGLSVSLADAERLKTLYGACIASPSDDRDSIAVHRVGDDMDHSTHLPKSELVRIIRPRVEEILELVRDRLAAAGHAAHAGRRLVLTGGACQLTGLPELARAIVSSQARIGRPLGVEGLPESAKSSGVRRRGRPDGLSAGGGNRAFRAAPVRVTAPASTDDGYVARVGRWLKESF